MSIPHVDLNPPHDVWYDICFRFTPFASDDSSLKLLHFRAFTPPYTSILATMIADLGENPTQFHWSVIAVWDSVEEEMNPSFFSPYHCPRIHGSSDINWIKVRVSQKVKISNTTALTASCPLLPCLGNKDPAQACLRLLV